MTTNFILRGTSELRTIYLRLREGREVDVKASTGIKIDPKHWNKRKSFPKDTEGFDDYDSICSQLNEISKSVSKYYKTATSNYKMDIAWLKEAMVFFNTEENINKSTLLNQLKHYKEQLESKNQNGKVGVSEGTLRNYNTSISRIKKFQEHRQKEVLLTDLNFKFHSDYLKFASNTLHLSQNSIGKDIRNIKAAAGEAKDMGIDVCDNVFSKRFNAPVEKTAFVTLTIDELDSIFNFKGTESLENAAQWLVIGSWTGCRVGDLLKLTKENLITENGRIIIRYKQSKTGKVVRLALHPHVKHILEKNNGEFPRRISDVKFNEYIKLVCKAVGLDELIEGVAFDPELKRRRKGLFPKWKLVRSHCCRRSFATNHYRKIPTSKLMGATGHSTEKMLLNYIGEMEENHVDDFIEVWSTNQKT